MQRHAQGGASRTFHDDVVAFSATLPHLIAKSFEGSYGLPAGDYGQRGQWLSRYVDIHGAIHRVARRYGIATLQRIREE